MCILGSLLSVPVLQIGYSKILAGILILQVIAFWHDGLTNFSGPLETRVFHRSFGDAILHNVFTSYQFGANVFGHRPNFGEGLYDVVRRHARALFNFVPPAGIGKAKDFPKGEFYLFDLVQKFINFAFLLKKNFGKKYLK
jgi:hypothetical protein